MPHLGLVAMAAAFGVDSVAAEASVEEADTVVTALVVLAEELATKEAVTGLADRHRPMLPLALVVDAEETMEVVVVMVVAVAGSTVV